MRNNSKRQQSKINSGDNALLFTNEFDSDNSTLDDSNQTSDKCPEVHDSPPPIVSTGFEQPDSGENNKTENDYVVKSQNSCQSVQTVFATTRAIYHSEKRKRPSLSPSNSSAIDEFDFEYGSEKKVRQNCDSDINATRRSSKFFSESRRKIVYSHNWSAQTQSDEKKDNKNISSSSTVNSAAVLGKVKQAQQCLESGELTDFREELTYILSTLLDANASQNLKHLSAIQLAKKCTIPEFRRFLRTQNVLGKIFTALSDAQGSLMIGLTTAAIIYFLARDQKSVPITDTTIRIMSDLLRQDQSRLNGNDEFKNHVDTIWCIVKDWLSKCAERTSKSIHFGFTESSMTASYLILEALAYVSIREHNDFFKTELLNSGCLQWIVAKLDKAVLKMSYLSVSDGHLMILEEIERCFRILENAAAFNKKNQAYLINHRNGLLLETGAKFLNYFKDYCDKYEKNMKIQSKNGDLLNELLDCICLLSRVFMNVSHENEFCSKKLGQKESFLYNCITILTIIAPRIISKDKFFDICVMLYGLLVNLVERCSSNRQKIIDLEIDFYDVETNNINSLPVLDAFTKLFIKHDMAARTLDEELDNELAFEDSTEDDEASSQGICSQQSTSSSTCGEHRFQRTPNEMTEDDVINAVQGAMNKASAHMEDSMLASYLALLIGCIVQTDQELGDRVKALLPDKKLDIMVEQLERFLEFMKLTKMKAGAWRSIERIIQSMQLL